MPSDAITRRVRIAALERLTPDIMRLFLALPPGTTFRYQPGQYIDILHQGAARSFSLACAPRQDGLLELHIRRVGGNPFTDFVFEKLSVADSLTIAGPFGSFTLEAPNRPRPRLFLAGGTGFAPIKSFIEALLRAQQGPLLHLYWGARQRGDLYLHEEACAWARSHGLHYVPVLSESEGDREWAGRRGLVHEAAAGDHPDLTGFEVYASGPPPMIEAARTTLLRQGLAAAHFHTEIY
ncbi:MAG TPA: NAD(P)H-flavin reductase [Gammaproteobacteria bacterium]|nr:NAD(P)H-flavin reductase [Gammaproteobacteria bacterium]